MSAGNEDTSLQRPDPLAIFPTADRSHLQGLPSKLNSSDESDYSFYGPFEKTRLAQSASEFIVSRSDASYQTIFDKMEDFLTVAVQDCYKIAAPADKSDIIHSCWLTIRAYPATDAFKQPRWHRDGRMFDCTCSKPKTPHSKYAFTFLGPSTLVLPPGAKVDKTFDAAERTWTENNRESLEKGVKEGREARTRLLEQERSFLAESMQKFDPVALDFNKIIRFSWGQSDSPIHSEPDFSATDRIFVSILFGSEKELREMCEFRDEKYGEVLIE